MDYRKHQEVAEIAAREAGAILMSSYRKVAAREKGPFDLVTDADIACQRRIAAILNEAFPDHTFLGEEEDARPDPDNPWRWIVDPLDGTANFAHGLAPWCVSIALEHAGELVVGAIYIPLEERMVSASKGLGTTINGVPSRVSDAGALSKSLIATGFPVTFDRDVEQTMAYFRRMSTGTHSVRRSGSSAWNLAMVAAGSVEVCYAITMHPWDAAAGVVLVREAGGTVTNLQGGPHDLYQEAILATNGKVHEETVAALNRAWP